MLTKNPKSVLVKLYLQWRAVGPSKREAVDLQINRRKWKWIVHTLCKSQTVIERQSLQLEPSRTVLKRKSKYNMEENGEVGGRSSRKNVGRCETMVRNKFRWLCFKGKKEQKEITERIKKQYKKGLKKIKTGYFAILFFINSLITLKDYILHDHLSYLTLLII